VPTPIDCVVPSESPDYIVSGQYCLLCILRVTFCKAPKDLFESQFVIELLAPFLKWCNGSRVDHGKPNGAVAMAATGVSKQLVANFIYALYE